jgi:regulator of protease activity HflC (stomatin/prohibitin superfamily)
MLDRLIDFFISTLKMFQFWVVIYPYEKGILLRLGKVHSVIECGFHWCLPFKIDRVLTVDTVVRTLRLGAQSLVTQDGKPVIINTVVTCEIADVELAALNVHSVEHVIDDSCSGIVAAFVADNCLEYIVSCCAEPDADLISHCRENAAQYGVSIIRVQFTDVSPSRTLRLLNSTNEASSYWAETNGRTDRL